MAKVMLSAVYGDLFVDSKSLEDKLKNGTYMFNCTCIRCGAKQKRAHQNLLTSMHPRCSHCSHTTTRAASLRKAKGLNPGPGVVILFRKDFEYLAVSDATVPLALDGLSSEAVQWLVQESPEMVIVASGERSSPLKGVNYQKLMETFALRKTFAGETLEAVAYDLPKLVKIPTRPPEAIQTQEELLAPIVAMSVVPLDPLREDYLLVASGHFKFFNWDREAPSGEVCPPYIERLAEEFEKKYGDITSYTFSSSPAPAGQVYIYWSRPEPTKSYTDPDAKPADLDYSLLVSAEDDAAMVCSNFKWNSPTNLAK